MRIHTLCSDLFDQKLVPERMAPTPCHRHSCTNANDHPRLDLGSVVAARLLESPSDVLCESDQFVIEVSRDYNSPISELGAIEVRKPDGVTSRQIRDQSVSEV